MKSILLIGLGRFGKHIAMELHSLGHQVMAVDHNEVRVNEALPFLTSAQIGDSTSEDFLSSLGVRNFAAALTTSGILLISTEIMICLKSICLTSGLA